MKEKTRMAQRQILIVDDNPENIQLAAGELQPEGYGIAYAQGGDDALTQAEETDFDLILLDVMMPKMDGFEVCTALKNMPQYKDVPVIFLTARGEKDQILHGFEIGGVDYVTKPFYGPELRSRVRAHLRFRDSQEQLEAINAELNKELLKDIFREEELRENETTLRRITKDLLSQATTDKLTGLRNRRSLLAIADYELTRSRRNGRRFAFIIGDLDHFKSINDRYGHATGDAVLQEIARRLESSVRAQDQVARWGGEEFVIFVPETDGDGAEILAEKLRRAVADQAVATPDGSIPVSMTLGLAGGGKGADITAVLNTADAALYEGKNAGRNCVVRRDPPVRRDPSSDPAEAGAATGGTASESQPGLTTEDTPPTADEDVPEAEAVPDAETTSAADELH
jgi:diguanylate cyclase (GGDEF)-like protein